MNTNRDRSPLLSVIVPVYNVEEYLPCCIDSILSQTFTDFELILVNDGSQDRSGEICDEYVQKDNRIVVIHQPNRGVSVARNRGLDIARGVYITFVDSDDQIGTKTTYEENIDIIAKNPQIDILQYPVFSISDKNEISKSNPSPMYVVGEREIFLNWYTGKLIRGYVCDKIFRKSVFENIRFPEGMQLAEDAFCIVDFVKAIKCLYISELGHYDYFYRENSATVQYSPKKCLDSFNCKMKHFAFLCTLENVELEKFNYFLPLYKEYLNVKIMHNGKILLKEELSIIRKHIPQWRFINKSCGFKDRLWLFLIKVLGIRIYSTLYIRFVLMRVRIKETIIYKIL